MIAECIWMDYRECLIPGGIFEQVLQLTDIPKYLNKCLGP